MCGVRALDVKSGRADSEGWQRELASVSAPFVSLLAPLSGTANLWLADKQLIDYGTAGRALFTSSHSKMAWTEFRTITHRLNLIKVGTRCLKCSICHSDITECHLITKVVSCYTKWNICLKENSSVFWYDFSLPSINPKQRPASPSLNKLPLHPKTSFQYGFGYFKNHNDQNTVLETLTPWEVENDTE